MSVKEDTAMSENHGLPLELTPQERLTMRARMNGYIFPNVPVTQEEQEAFEAACALQIEHERHQREATAGMQLPDGTTGFVIGHFQMTFGDGAMSSRLSRKTICDAAYGILLRAGLLYRGVEREGRRGACR